MAEEPNHDFVIVGSAQAAVLAANLALAGFRVLLVSGEDRTTTTIPFCLSPSTEDPQLAGSSLSTTDSNPERIRSTTMTIRAYRA
jgi:hypothetical protein